ncbi:MAG: hypothetical protein P1P78_15260 [Methyloprofundus sp.]|nr:hypothetical protein [Methyloprofundus sp.]
MAFHYKIFPKCLLYLGLTASISWAESTTLSFTGTVTSTDANTVKIAEVDVGDQVTGQYTFGSAAADETPSDPALGLYPVSQLNISVGGFNWSATNNKLSVVNNASGAALDLTAPVIDFYELVSPLAEVSGPDLSGLSPAQIEFNLVDTDGIVFSDDSLPQTLNIDTFEITSEASDGARGGHIVFRSVDGSQLGEIRFEVTDISGGSSGPPTMASLTISPPSGNYASTQSFDAAFLVNAPNVSIVSGSASFDGTDITAFLAGCLI